MAQSGLFGNGCPHCGSVGTRRLGECSVCAKTVCEHCGSMQVSAGLRKPVHRECLKNAGHFKMIKFAP